MNTKHLCVLICGVLLLATGCAGVRGVVPSAFTPTAAVGGTPILPATALAGAFTYPNTTLKTVTLVPEGSENIVGIGAMREHVVVTGKMNERVSPVDGKTYAIGFEMRLPTNWNGRFFYQANGGVDGMVVKAYGKIWGGGPTTNALKKGFAVISSDAGHAMEAGTIGGGLFGIDPQARADYGYNAVAQLTPMAKNLIKTYYGKFPDKSYLVGCSNGGRHGMVAASRRPEQYDGILAVSPGYTLPKAAVAQLWGVQQYATISDMSAKTGRPDISTSFTPAELALVSDAIVSQCDAIDGVTDHMVTNISKCQTAFDIYAHIPTCTGARDGRCLTIGQKVILASVHAGARNSKGEALYVNFPWDPGISSANWRSWKFVSSITNRDPLAVGFIFTTPPQDPAVLNGTGNTLFDYAINWTGAGFNVDRDGPKIYATNSTYPESAISFMLPPDLLMKKLPSTHTKLIVAHGSADGIFSVADTVNWYNAFRAYYGNSASDLARLFIVPGMAHCGGGPACDQFDMVDALVTWVETGKAPDSVVAKARGTGANVVNTEVPATWSANRTRLLCPYPMVPKYDGTGNIEVATSFSCVAP
jgi:pimeloyl-ACP methyl ester carboxylesterase